MSDSRSDSSRISGSDHESPQKPSGSISNVRRRAFLRNKKRDSEDTVTTGTEDSGSVPDENEELLEREENDKHESFVGQSSFLASRGIFTKNIKKMLPPLALILLLLVLLVVLLQSFWIRNPGGNSRESKTTLSIGSSSEKLYGFESALKKLHDQVEAFEQATRMVQEKLASLDEKMRKIDSQNSLVQTKLNNMELKVSGFPQSSQHAETTPDDLTEQLHRTMSQKLVEISDVAKRVVEEELERHEADGIGKPDHALASGGAFILRHSEPNFPINKNNHLVHSEAITMLRPSFGESGRCFSLKGSSGFVEIQLRTQIVPESVTLEHVSSRVAYNMSSAPKDCVVSAWFLPQNLSSIHGQHEMDKIEVHKLVSCRYDLQKNKTRQTFEVERRSNVSEDLVVNVVRFDFVSNYGADHTCIYRLRVHGHEANVSVIKATERRSSATSNSVSKFVLLLVIYLAIPI